MVINYKYFILSTAFIFIALGVGLVIGFMFDAQQIMVSQKEDIITQLEDEFNTIKTENELLKKQNKVLEADINKQIASIKLLYKKAISNRLNNSRISLITYNLKKSPVEYNEAISDAGGQILRHIKINDLKIELLEGEDIKTSLIAENSTMLLENFSFILKNLKKHNTPSNYDFEKEMEGSIEEVILIVNTAGKKEEDYMIVIQELYDFCLNNEISFISILDTKAPAINEVDLPMTHLEESIETLGGKIDLITILESISRDFKNNLSYSLR